MWCGVCILNEGGERVKEFYKKGRGKGGQMIVEGQRCNLDAGVETVILAFF